MYDEMTNSDFICLLNDYPSTDQWEIFTEAARRIRNLEKKVIDATNAIERIEDAAYSAQDWSDTRLGEAIDNAKKAVGTFCN